MKEFKDKISVLCPGFVNTKIMDAERNCPKKYLNELSEMKQIHDPQMWKKHHNFSQLKAMAIAQILGGDWQRAYDYFKTLP